MAEIQHGHRYHVRRLVEKTDAAVRESRGDRGIEDHVPAVQRRVRHALADHVDVIGDSRGAPHVRDAVQVARVVDLHLLEDPGIEVVPQRQPAAVERLVHADRDQARGVPRAVDDDVIAGLAGQEFGLDDFRRIVEIVVHLDAELGFELGDGRRSDVIGPVVDVEHPLFFGERAQRRQQRTDAG